MPTGNLPIDVRRPGTFHYFDDTSSARGQTPIDRSVALIGCKKSSGTATVNVPIQVFNESEADTYFGVGSELALMCRMAFKVFRFLQSRIRGATAAQVWAVPIAEPAGAAATRTLTVTGTATATGNITIRVAGRTILVPVKLGDVQNAIATAIKTSIDKVVNDLPCTASVATNVATLTYGHLGVNGNDLKTTVVESVPGVTVVAANGVSGTGVADIQPALDAMGSRHYRSVACANHAAQDVTDFGEHADLMWGADAKKYRHMFLAEVGTLGTATTLASPANRKEIVISSIEGGRMLPGEYAAAVAAMTQTVERPNRNWDNTELPVYGTDDSLSYETAEVETALGGGVTPLVMTPTGGVKVTRLVTTKATHNGAAFERLRDYSVSNTTAYYALQADVAVLREMEGRNVDAALLNDLRSAVFDVLKSGEDVGDLHNVDAHAEEIVVIPHPSLPSRILIELPQSVVPNAHQADLTHRLHVEAPA